MKWEFKKDDILVPIGHVCAARVVGRGGLLRPPRYFVRWSGGGDSMLVKGEVEATYVKVGHAADADVAAMWDEGSANPALCATTGF